MLDVRGGAGARHEDAVRAEVEGLLDADAVVGAADADHLRGRGFRSGRETLTGFGSPKSKKTIF